jgi:hypothetical protein
MSSATFPSRRDERLTVGAAPTRSNDDARGRELVGVLS